VQSLAEAEFLAPPSRLITDEDRRRHRQAQRRLIIAEHDERLMEQWRESFPGDVLTEREFYAAKKEERRADRRRRRDFIFLNQGRTPEGSKSCYSLNGGLTNYKEDH
jgi:hypothetical protein